MCSVFLLFALCWCSFLVQVLSFLLNISSPGALDLTNMASRIEPRRTQWSQPNPGWHAIPADFIDPPEFPRQVEYQRLPMIATTAWISQITNIKICACTFTINRAVKGSRKHPFPWSSVLFSASPACSFFFSSFRYCREAWCGVHLQLYRQLTLAYMTHFSAHWSMVFCTIKLNDCRLHPHSALSPLASCFSFFSVPFFSLFYFWGAENLQQTFFIYTCWQFFFLGYACIWTQLSCDLLWGFLHS